MAAWLLLASASGCDARPGATTTIDSAPSASASPVASVAIDAGKKPDPLIDELCAALHSLPEARRAACCQRPASLDLGDECRRGLAASVGEGTIALDAAEVRACVVAMEQSFQGCDHVGPNRPPLPAACVGIVHGRSVAKTACRSSLECADGLRCHGLGPASAGTCDVPRADGEPCGSTVEVLATYTGQRDLTAKHRECIGRCDGQKCVAAPSAPPPPPRLDQPCPQGVCGDGARCVSGKCVAPKPAGAPCDVDRECIGGCLKPPGTKSGKCGMRCDLP